MDFLKAGRCGKLDPTSGVTEEWGVKASVMIDDLHWWQQCDYDKGTISWENMSNQLNLGGVINRVWREMRISERYFRIGSTSLWVMPQSCGVTSWVSITGKRPGWTSSHKRCSVVWLGHKVKMLTFTGATGWQNWETFQFSGVWIPFTYSVIILTLRDLFS